MTVTNFHLHALLSKMLADFVMNDVRAHGHHLIAEMRDADPFDYFCFLSTVLDVEGQDKNGIRPIGDAGGRKAARSACRNEEPPAPHATTEDQDAGS